MWNNVLKPAFKGIIMGFLDVANVDHQGCRQGVRLGAWYRPEAEDCGGEVRGLQDVT
jgi:hypothetical protein